MRKIIKEVKLEGAGKVDVNSINLSLKTDLESFTTKFRVYFVSDDKNSVGIDSISNISTLENELKTKGYVSGTTGNKYFTCKSVEKYCSVTNKTASSSQNTKTDNTTKTDNKTQQSSGDPSSNFDDTGRFTGEKNIATAAKNAMANALGPIAEDVKKIKKLMNL
jgi:hypothetical protein